jgi:hypothetical protein
MKKTLIVAAGAVLAASFVMFGVTTPVAQGDNNNCLTQYPTGSAAQRQCFEQSQAQCGHAGGCDVADNSGQPICRQSNNGDWKPCQRCVNFFDSPGSSHNPQGFVEWACGSGGKPAGSEDLPPCELRRGPNPDDTLPLGYKKGACAGTMTDDAGHISKTG